VEPVGVVEIAQRAEVTREAVNKWRERYGAETEHPFPAPAWTVGGRPAWDWPAVETWLRKTKRLD
jgi:hypothetical protein